MGQKTERFSLRIEGQVQGVGFRPWIFRLVGRLPLTGFVRNDTAGVLIEVQGESDNLAAFIAALKEHQDAPPLARITRLDSRPIPILADERGFVIAESDAAGKAVAGVTPDTAVCAECRQEMGSPADFRSGYPFINCTNCGPRYTIIRSVPYDRPGTTMSPFMMCQRCADEYRSPANRRFHAQPVACPACGPHLQLLTPRGGLAVEGDEPAISRAAQLLAGGRILAIKGIGGFHLAVDACNEEAVQRLRSRKHREHKPFAMMARLEDIGRCAEISPLAESMLASPQAPIILLPQKAGGPLAASIAPGTKTFGFMLPYAPLHHLLFEKLREIGTTSVLVMTSANLADQPLICRNDEALAKLSNIADFFLMHDRDIFRQLDDSVVHFINETPVPLRRARGYVPEPVYSQRSWAREILAAGSDLKNTFCLGSGNRFIVSEHIGDLEDADVYRHYRRSVQHLSGLFEFSPSMVVADLHPGYYSTQYAGSLENVELMQVQHHWAHIASVLAEHDIDGPVIGIAADGTGYGTDGAIWGCECLIASLSGFSRFAHLRYFPLPGGDKASRESVRPLIALLEQTYGEGFKLSEYRWLLDRIEPDQAKLSLILEQVRKGINTVSTSSLGRVFDAVAAAAGIGSYNNFEAQLPIALEAAAEARCEDAYGFDMVAGEPLQIDMGRMLRSILDDIRADVPVGIVSARLHNTIAAAFADTACKAREVTGLDIVAISGGVFCNRLLAGRTIDLLNNAGFRVLYNVAVPANDGGLSLGQAAIGASLSRK
jgi:hydrogenase maturation protein HypF